MFGVGFMNKGAIIIPARYESSRFPGKPLAEIHGKTMIQRVYERCVEAVGDKAVYVATDDIRIEQNVNSFGGQFVRTSTNCLTGTDRLAEANEKLSLDYVVNVQGDEPLINPKDISKVFLEMKSDSSSVINCYCELSDYERDMHSVPKVVISNSRKLLYMSRGGIPFDKLGNPNPMFKQVCIYGYSREHLKIFANSKSKQPNENFEDIEILRFLELDINVKMLKVDSGSIAVDTLIDLDRARALFMK